MDCRGKVVNGLLRRPVRTATEFLAQSLKAGRVWNEVFQASEKDNFQTRLFCTATLSFKVYIYI